MSEKIFQEGTFGYDLHFLSQHDKVIVLAASDPDMRVIVSAKYQAKVFTSTAEGDDGRSFGWVNYKAFSGPADAHMNAYGGENRMWLGPEGGQFSLFFKPGDEMVFENWKTPAAVDTEPWTVVSRSAEEVRFWKYMELMNYQGAVLKLMADRRVKVLDRDVLAARLGVRLTDAVRAVGYETDNSITNKCDEAWTDVWGMPCIWMLDMFRPSPATVVVIPFQSQAGEAVERIVTSNYFGEIGADRLKYGDGVVFFKADGRCRGKLGIRPENARTVAGSYDADGRVLTITVFQTDGKAKYLNQEWNTEKPAFLGDAVNAYNDGALGDGGQLGPFYELESVSPAAFLAPGEKMTHAHAVFHFTGEENGLDVIARELLGVSLADIKNRF